MPSPAWKKMWQCIAQRPRSPRGDEIALGSVIQAHSVHQAVPGWNVDNVDELVVVKLEDRGACRILDESNRLDREAVRVPGMMRSTTTHVALVADRQLEQVPKSGEAARRDAGDRREVAAGQPCVEAEAVDFVDRREPREPPPW